MQITLFFTYGVGLSTWQQRGLFSREVGYYRALTKHGVDRVVFVSYDPRDTVCRVDLERDNIMLCVRPSWIPNIVYSIISPILHWKLMKSTTIFKTNQMSGSWSGVIAKIIWRKPLIVRTGYTWSDFQKKLHKPFRRIAAVGIEYVSTFFANLVIVTTDVQKELLPRYTHAYTTVLPNYIDTDLFCPQTATIAEDSLSLITVGRLSAQKNLFLLLDVVSQIPACTLTIVGDGELRQQLQEYADALGITVCFLGIVSNDTLPHVLTKADVFVSTTEFEGNPKTILEAMSCALPVVAGRVPGIVDIIEHGVNGFLSDLSAKQFADMIRYVHTHTQIAHTVGQSARRWIIGHQSLEKIVSQEISLYYTVCI